MQQHTLLRGLTAGINNEEYSFWECGMPTAHQQVREATEAFLDAFELVFDNDWENTVAWLAGDGRSHVIADRGTFLHPAVADESNNWANRGHLLAEYRRLRVRLRSSLDE